MSCALAERWLRWGVISVSRCYLLLWNSRKIRNNFNFDSSYLNYCFISKNLRWKEHPSLLFTTGVKPREQKKICNFLELEAMIWEDKVSSVRNYLYMTSLTCFCNIRWESLHCSRSCSISPMQGNLWYLGFTPVQRHHPKITPCQNTLRSITFLFRSKHKKAQ